MGKDRKLDSSLKRSYISITRFYYTNSMEKSWSIVEAIFFSPNSFLILVSNNNT